MSNKLVRLDPNAIPPREQTRARPNVIPIYEVGQVDDQPFFSMKIVEGGNLTRDAERLWTDFTFSA
jgi:hypothetical protein